MDFSISPAQNELIQLIREEAGCKLAKIRKKYINKAGFKKEILSTLSEYNLVCPTIPLQYLPSRSIADYKAELSF